MKRCNKKKAPLGAILGSVVGGLLSIGGSAISGAKQAQLAREQARQQNRLNNRRTVLESSSNLTNAYGNQEYIDEFQKRIVPNTNVYKLGGKVKKKFEGGGSFDYSSLINGVMNGITNMGTASINSVYNTKTQRSLNNIGQPITTGVGAAKEYIEKPDYVTNNIDSRLLLNNNLRIAKYGTKQMRCKR